MAAGRGVGGISRGSGKEPEGKGRGGARGRGGNWSAGRKGLCPTGRESDGRRHPATGFQPQPRRGPQDLN